jgi:hypothetical protein
MHILFLLPSIVSAVIFKQNEWEIYLLSVEAIGLFVEEPWIEDFRW